MIAIIITIIITIITLVIIILIFNAITFVVFTTGAMVLLLLRQSIDYC